MTGKAEFDEQEWDAVLEGPTSAGVIVMRAERGGTFRETFAMAKVYAEARQEHGESELLDAITAHRPEVDRTRVAKDEVEEHGLERIREALALVDQKASADEAAAYRRFVSSVARRVAEAKEEKGSQGGVAESEQRVLDEIDSVLSGSS
jgi:hypothetical protein